MCFNICIPLALQLKNIHLLFCFVFFSHVFCSNMTVDGKHEKSIPPHQSVYVLQLSRSLCKQIMDSLALIACPPLSLNEKTCSSCVLCRVGATLNLSPLSGMPLLEELVEDRSPWPHHITQLSACLFIKPGFVLSHRACSATTSLAKCGVFRWKSPWVN